MEVARLKEGLPPLWPSFSQQVPKRVLKLLGRAARYNFVPMASGKGWGREPKPVFIWNAVNVWVAAARQVLILLGFYCENHHQTSRELCPGAAKSAEQRGSSQCPRLSQGPSCPWEPRGHLTSVPTALPLLSALQSGEASLFEVNIRYIGGLLSAFYLTGEEVSWCVSTPWTH